MQISAKITDPDGVTNVVLQYQLVDPGNYIEITDAAYTNNWVSTPMVLGADDVYAAMLPSSVQTHRRLVRYRITATDAGGRSVRVPYADDPQPNFAYFVYNGVPEWRGGLQPVNPATTFSTPVMRRLPVYHLISKRSSVETATWFERYGGDLYKWRGTMVYDGKVYDHIGYRARGGVWRYAMTKNMWKFDFNRGHDFEPRDDYGRKYDVPWTKLNLGASIQQGDFEHRGEQGMFESVGFKLFNLAGVESPHTTFVQFRVIDEAAESYSTNQYEGDFWGVYLAIEQENGRFLDEHGLPDGNFYKMEGGTGELNNLGPAGPTDKSDLNYLLNNYGAATDDWWRTNVDVAKYYSYQTIVQAIHHYDICYDKNFFYFRNPETGLWSVHSWDLDLTWANNMYDSGCGGIDRFKQRLLNNTRPVIEMEWRNRIREVRDLLFNTDQAFRLIDEFAWRLRGPTNGPTLIDADRFMWDYNPKMNNATYTSTPSKAGQGRFYVFSLEGSTIPASVRGTFDATIQLMKNYVTNRSAFIDAIAADNTIPTTPTISSTSPSNYPLNRLTFRSANYSGVNAFAAMKWRIAAITPTNFPVQALNEPARYEITPAWESDEITAFNSDITIPSSVVRVGDTYRVRARFKDVTGRWSRWSAPVQFVCGPPDTSAALLAYLRISELMYNSPGGSEYDFVELHNSSSQLALELNGAKFTQGIDYTFGTGVIIPPNGYLVLAKTPAVAAFRAYYNLPASVPVLGGYTGNFSDGGEQVTLRTSAGGTDIVTFEYRDSRGWPLAADGSGHSLVPLNEGLSLTYGGNWRASTYINGSPGGPDPAPPEAPVLNEIVAHTDFQTEFDSNDWIELYNPSTNDFTFAAGWYLSDHNTNLTKWMIPEGTVVPARGWVSFDEQTGFHNPTNIGFGLDKDGEQVFLSYLPGGAANRVVDAVSFKAQQNDWSVGRYPDGAQFWDALTPRTRDRANAAPPLHLVISEVMYHPPDVNSVDDTVDEYIEIFNPTPNAVPLFGTNAAWRLDGGVNMAFPPDLTLGPASYLLVVNFDPADAAQSNAFRATYSLSNPNVQIIGPYSGKLANDSERIALEQPLPGTPTTNVAWVIVDEFIYADRPPFEIAADGFGPSLHRQDMLRHASDPANWRAAAPTPGGPYGGGVPPTITQQPAPPARTSPAGENITYNVTADGTEPLSFQWRFNGRVLSGATQSTLLLSNVQPANSGEYNVLVLNPAGSALSASVQLNVTTPPQILTHPQGKDVRLGSNVTFSVSAVGTGTLYYQWRKSDVAISGATNAIYDVLGAQLADEGAYTVAIGDVNGFVVSEPALLRILIDLAFVQQPVAQAVVVGGTVTFSAAVSGNPPPFGFEWRKSSTPLASNVVMQSSDFYTITNVQTADAGSYRVVVRNAARPGGLGSALVPLTVLADADHDGMPDVWETQYGFSNGDPSDAALDADGDGASNVAEYDAGTDPRDPTSYLRVENISADFVSTASVRISWLARTNKTYTVLYRDTVVPGLWSRLTDVQAASTNRIVQVIDQPPVTSTRRFYRLATPRLP
ncbi:MAG TPA: lamin tail domain-containing protein [Verrucomicrobiae bacterium]|nr:lamin tail domain-containing protein [Verrucomicrobiae bacterium]